jgi:hypothetical protein
MARPTASTPIQKLFGPLTARSDILSRTHAPVPSRVRPARLSADPLPSYHRFGQKSGCHDASIPGISMVPLGADCRGSELTFWR